MGGISELALFGAEAGWSASDWTASDDTVRGGISHSFLDVSASSARFYGTLDITTLGDAGFASQRTTGENRSWDLSAYDGIVLNLGKSDGKRYSFNLKDQLLPPTEDGREQATISWEYDFKSTNATALAESSSVFIAWDQLTPTYRGREQTNVTELDLKKVKRFSIMMRSYFGEQEGDYSLTIESIKAAPQPKDLENGSLGKRADVDESQDERRPLFNKSTLAPILGIVTVTACACLLFCYLMKERRAVWL